MHESDEKLCEVEPDRERALERDVDRHERARFGDRDQQVLRAGIAVGQGLRQLIEQGRT